MSKGRMAGHTQKTAGEGFTIKGKGGERAGETEKQNYTIKMSNPAAKAVADSTAPQNANNNQIKMPSKKTNTKPKNG